jgi:hypothetical protein
VFWILSGIFSIIALIVIGIAALIAIIFGIGVAIFSWKRHQIRRRYIRYY